MYSKLDFHKEFQNYAMNHLGVTGMQFYAMDNLQQQMYSNVMVPMNYQTPYIIEEREMRVTQMDIFSRLMMDRILYLSGVVHDQMSSIVSTQLLFLNSLDTDLDITIYIDSPGGSVKSGLTIVDTMGMINCDVKTINTGMAASMGSILLGAGTKGKRAALENSRVMLHQLSHGVQGNIQDTKISMTQAEIYNEKLFKLLGEYTNKDPEVVLADATRDNWLDAEQALAYGIIDEVLVKLKK